VTGAEPRALEAPRLLSSLLLFAPYAAATGTRRPARRTHDTPGVGQRQLGEALRLDPNNTVLMLNDLEGEGWPSAVATPTTAAGTPSRSPPPAQALIRAEQALDGLEEDVLDGLSPDERATLRELLARAMAGAPVPV
jgi:DNA-binding MarR family transcriptional regulator